MLFAQPNGPELSCGGEEPPQRNPLRAWHVQSDCSCLFRACEIVDSWFRQLERLVRQPTWRCRVCSIIIEPRAIRKRYSERGSDHQNCRKYSTQPARWDKDVDTTFRDQENLNLRVWQPGYRGTEDRFVVRCARVVCQE
jgi:hypothetical protein